ncbi:unnamed protein product, partial [Prorocentrum cordatum]
APVATSRPTFIDDLRMRCSDCGCEVQLGDKDVVAHFREYMKGFEEHAEWHAEGGEFLPLSVWATRGFDMDTIKDMSHPWDIRPDRMFTNTHRVPIYSAGTAGKKGKRREGVEERGGKRAKVAGAESDKSESSSDSSSSDSRRHKKKRKSRTDKKSNKEKDSRKAKKEKEREKQTKLLEAAAKKQAAKALKGAESVRDKVQEMRDSLVTIVGNPNFAGTPPNVRTTVEEDNNKVQDIYNDVEAIIRGDNDCTIRHFPDVKAIKSYLAGVKRKLETVRTLIRQAGTF